MGAAWMAGEVWGPQPRPISWRERGPLGRVSGWGFECQGCAKGRSLSEPFKVSLSALFVELYLTKTGVS